MTTMTIFHVESGNFHFQHENMVVDSILPVLMSNMCKHTVFIVG